MASTVFLRAEDKSRLLRDGQDRGNSRADQPFSSTYATAPDSE